MLNQILSYFKLAIFCFRLLFNLLFFLLVFLFKKTNIIEFFSTIIFILLILAWIFNFYLFNQKNTPKIVLEKTTILNGSSTDCFKPNKEIFKEEKFLEKLEYYTSLNKMNIKNPNLLLNLAQLSILNKNENLSEKYFEQAQQIEPKLDRL